MTGEKWEMYWGKQRRTESYHTGGCMVVYGVVYGGERWCTVVYGGVWWCMVVYGGVWWCMVVYGGVWWCMVVNGGVWWCMVAYGVVYGGVCLSSLYR
jgi:hypothetical protein